MILYNAVLGKLLSKTMTLLISYNCVGKNGRPNLTATNDKESSPTHGTSKTNGQRFITGPDGSKWVLFNGLNITIILILCFN